MNRVTLGEIATIERKSVEPDELDPRTKYLGLEHIERGGRIIGHDTVGHAGLASSKFSFTPDHLLYGKLRPNLGKISRPQFSGVCSTDILPVLPGPRLDRGYLAHYLAQPEMVDFAASRAAGANLPRLSPAVLASFEVPLPAIEEQRRIAAVLDQAEAVRAKRRQVLTHLASLTQSIFLDMFGDPTKGATAALGELGEIQIGPFGSLLHQEDYVQGGVPLVNPMHITDGVIRADAAYSVTDEKARSLESYRIRAGDVVLGRRGEMGRAAVAEQSEDGYLCGTGSLIIRPDASRATAKYLQAALTQRASKLALERQSLGSTLPNLNATIVRNFRLLEPDLDCQEEFARRAAEVDVQRARIRRALAVEDGLFASLQAHAFEGEL